MPQQFFRIGWHFSFKRPLRRFPWLCKIGPYIPSAVPVPSPLNHIMHMQQQPNNPALHRFLLALLTISSWFPLRQREAKLDMRSDWYKRGRDMRFKASVSFFLEQDYKQFKSSKNPTNNTTFAYATTVSIPCTPPSPPSTTQRKFVRIYYYTYSTLTKSFSSPQVSFL